MNQATPPMKPATPKWNNARLRVNIKQTQGMVTRTVKPKPAIALPSLVLQLSPHWQLSLSRNGGETVIMGRGSRRTVSHAALPHDDLDIRAYRESI